MPYKDSETKKQYQALYQRRHYSKNTEYYKNKAKIRKLKISTWYKEFKKNIRMF